MIAKKTNRQTSYRQNYILNIFCLLTFSDDGHLSDTIQAQICGKLAQKGAETLG